MNHDEFSTGQHQYLRGAFLSTPPAVNDEAPGASGADSGQGVCIPLYSLTYRENTGPMAGAVTTECDLWASNAVIALRSLLGRGIDAVTVEVQL